MSFEVENTESADSEIEALEAQAEAAPEEVREKVRPILKAAVVVEQYNKALGQALIDQAKELLDLGKNLISKITE